jgi:hypothetical protein
MLNKSFHKVTLIIALEDYALNDHPKFTSSDTALDLVVDKLEQDDYIILGSKAEPVNIVQNSGGTGWKPKKVKCNTVIDIESETVEEKKNER